MNVVRINMSHADHAGAGKIMHWIKTLNRQVPYPVPVMLDAQGPEIRTGVIQKPMPLKPGQVVTLTVRGTTDVETSSIHVNYQELVDVIHPGNRVTVDNGLINFEVLRKENHALVCKVIDGGMLGSRRHVNLPGTRVNLPAVTEKDRADILFGLANDIDFVALSFVRDVDDIEDLKKLLGRKADKVKIIAKIEDQEGVRNVHRIVQAAGGVMVARGDLGIETDIADLPSIQRRFVHAAAVHGKRCIVATHLLESMITNPIPTRAEVTDVANAIYEGTDAVMLSGETSLGAHPDRCVAQLHAIAEQSERWPALGHEKDLEARSDKQHVTIHARVASCRRHCRHHAAWCDGGLRDRGKATARTDLRIHQQQSDTQATRAQSLGLCSRNRIQQRSRTNLADCVARAASTRRIAAECQTGGDLRCACRPEQ